MALWCTWPGAASQCGLQKGVTEERRLGDGAELPSMHASKQESWCFPGGELAGEEDYCSQEAGGAAKGASGCHGAMRARQQTGWHGAAAALLGTGGEWHRAGSVTRAGWAAYACTLNSSAVKRAMAQQNSSNIVTGSHSPAKPPAPALKQQSGAGAGCRPCRPLPAGNTCGVDECLDVQRELIFADVNRVHI